MLEQHTQVAPDNGCLCTPDPSSFQCYVSAPCTLTRVALWSLQGALQVMENAVAAASKKPERAELLLSQDARNQLRKSEDDYRVFLAPFLHGPRSAAARCLFTFRRH